MRKRVQLAVAVSAVAMAGAMVWRMSSRPQEPEPVYQGKGLHAWLSEARVERYWETNGTAEVAVRQIGTNAIPTLLNMLCTSDSPSTLKLIKFWNRHIFNIHYLPQWIRRPSWYRNQAAVLNEEAAVGFKILGAEAQQAVPELINIYGQHISLDSQAAASSALIGIGQAARTAIPSFVREAGSPDLATRYFAVRALSLIHGEPSLVVPALASSLNDTNNTIRVASARGLGDCGVNAQEVFPALVRLLSDPDADVRDAATNALKAIDPEAAAKAGVK